METAEGPIELSLDQLEGVAGGLSFRGSLMGVIGGQLVDMAVNKVGDMVSSGGAPDYSRTTAAGDMY